MRIWRMRTGISIAVTSPNRFRLSVRAGSQCAAEAWLNAVEGFFAKLGFDPLVPDLARDDVAEQLPALAVELH
jgi:hypothetical protein